jgi:hypothetical protein
MNAMASGTIIVGVTRDNYAILATDRLWSTHGNDEPFRSGSHRKISLHKRLPIAIATAGITTVYRHRESPRNNLIRVRTYIETILRRISIIDSNTIPLIKSEYERLILPGLTRARAENWHIPNRIAKTNIFVIVVSLYDNTPQIHAIGLDAATGNVTTEPHPAFIMSPSSLNDLYKQHYKENHTYGYFLGEHIHDQLRLSSHIYNSIATGIHEEAKKYAGQNRECGGGIDIALIDAHGARLICLGCKNL